MDAFDSPRDSDSKLSTFIATNAAPKNAPALAAPASVGETGPRYLFIEGSLADQDMLAKAGRDRSLCSITICLYPEELDAFGPDQVGTLARYEELGVSRCIVGLNAEKREGILPVLDRWAGFIRKMRDH